MKVTYSLPDELVTELKAVASATGYTQSGLLTTALNIYFLLYHADNQKAKAVAELIPDNQTSIFDFIKSRSTRSPKSG